MITQERLFYILMASFVAWLTVLLVYLLPKILATPSSIDPLMAFLSGIGIGGVSQFFMLLLKDSWQFFFRKKPPV